MTPALDIFPSLQIFLQNSIHSALPRYRQLYEALRQQILEGQLPPGVRLPSSRCLAEQLNLSRNTVLAAIDQLCAEGYAVAKAASGIYVLPTLPANWDVRVDAKSSPRRHLPLSSRGQRIYADAQRPGARGAFTPGIPDLKQFPFALWQRYINRYARNPRIHWQGYPQEGGHAELRVVIAQHLRIFRGIQCDPQQVLITHGTQSSLRLAADLLADPGDLVWMENPGYPGARSTFAAAGLIVRGQPVDAEGLAPSPTAWQKPPHLIYATPSHQYPLGMVMSAARRRQLLLQAAPHQTWFIEDDYDSEFRHAGAPLMALQALSPAQVIYLGTFSKTLFPALRMGYAVLPEDKIDAFRAAQARHHREPAYVLQSALADFMSDGHYHAHIRKMRQEYQSRRDALVELFHQNLGNVVDFHGLDTGLHVTASFPARVDTQRVEFRAYQQGVIARSLQNYYLRPTSRSGQSSALVLGYGDANQNAIACAGKILMQIIQDEINASKPEF
jgi:GntR family transcriptional regulator/MocR family aminotransferase